VIRGGVARTAADAYDALRPLIGRRRPWLQGRCVSCARRASLRLVASPDYRYEGGVYVRRVPNTHWKTWDTVSVHALYRAGDDTTWGRLHVVERTIVALQWLEAIYGPYAYPQMTVLHRLDGGGRSSR